MIGRECRRVYLLTIELVVEVELKVVCSLAMVRGPDSIVVLIDGVLFRCAVSFFLEMARAPTRYRWLGGPIVIIVDGFLL